MLVLIRSYHVTLVFMVLQPKKRFYINQNPNPNHNPEAIHNPNQNPNPNPNPKQSNSYFTSLLRDQNSFLPIIY